jgi:hypothetical protein
MGDNLVPNGLSMVCRVLCWKSAMVGATHRQLLERQIVLGRHQLALDRPLVQPPQLGRLRWMDVVHPAQKQDEVGFSWSSLCDCQGRGYRLKIAIGIAGKPAILHLEIASRFVFRETGG